MSNFIAIDLDSHGLYAVAGTRFAVKVTHALAWTADDGAPPPPLTAETAKAIGEKLRDKLRKAEVPPAPVVVAVGRDRVILKELKYPPVPPSDEPALVRFQAMKEMSESPEDVVLDYAPLSADAGQRRSMAVVLRKDTFNAIQAMCQAAGLKLAGVTPRPYAIAAGLVRAFGSAAAEPPDDKDDAVAVLTLGPSGGEFTVVRRDEVSFTLAIPAPVMASETMVIAQVRRNLTGYAGQHPGHPITALYLAEAGEVWAPRLRTALTVPVHTYDPLDGAARSVPGPIRGRFAGAVGLLAGKAADALPINFAAPRAPRATRDPAKRTLALVGLAALVLIVIGGAGGLYMVSAGDTRVAKLTQDRDKLKEQLAAGAPDAARIKGIDGWTKRNVVWLDELYELCARMALLDDSVRVASMTATALPVGKDGKQDAQANLELKLAATDVPAATQLESAFVRDNPTPNRYYPGVGHTVGPPLPGAAKHNQSVTLTTRVNHRDPKEYDKVARFAPVKKTGGGTSGVPAPAPPTEPPEAAPPPTEKP